MTQPADPIARVSVISTGAVSIRPEHVGPTWKNLHLWLATSRRWTSPRPINVYVIEHCDGLVLFDTGQDRASVTDPGYFPKGLNGLAYSRLAKFEIRPDDTLTAGLAALGHRSQDVDIAVISHLHQDHIGGLPFIGGARIMVHRDEWNAFAKPLPEARGFLRTHIDLPGLNWDRIIPERLTDQTFAPFTHGHDLFGDLTYDADLLAAGKLPGVGNKKQMRGAVKKVNTLRQTMPTLTVLPAHDPGAAARLATALAHPSNSGASPDSDPFGEPSGGRDSEQND